MWMPDTFFGRGVEVLTITLGLAVLALIVWKVYRLLRWTTTKIDEWQQKRSWTHYNRIHSPRAAEAQRLEPLIQNKWRGYGIPRLSAISNGRRLENFYLDIAVPEIYAVMAVPRDGSEMKFLAHVFHPLHWKRQADDWKEELEELGDEYRIGIYPGREIVHRFEAKPLIDLIERSIAGGHAVGVNNGEAYCLETKEAVPVIEVK